MRSSEKSEEEKAVYKKKKAIKISWTGHKKTEVRKLDNNWKIQWEKKKSEAKRKNRSQWNVHVGWKGNHQGSHKRAKRGRQR